MEEKDEIIRELREISRELISQVDRCFELIELQSKYTKALEERVKYYETLKLTLCN